MMKNLKKNEIYACEITGWSSDGAGVTHVGGQTVFVPGTIPGEKWEVRIVKARASEAFGKGERCLRASQERIEPDCPAYPRCGGCALRHMSYEKELEFKLSRVNEAYARIGGLELRASEILRAERTEAYRNKAIYAVTPDLRPGFFRPRSHEAIPIERCRLQSEASDRAARAVCGFCREQGVPPYDEAAGKGVLRHVFTRTARDGAMQVTVVAAGGFGAKTAALADAVRRACPETEGVILNVNKTAGNTVLAGDFYTLWGADTLRDTLCGADFELSPMSFYQVHPAQAERLYAKALEFAAPEGGECVLDLYCGAGTISLCLARRAKRVIGAELVPAAVENARANAERNGFRNVEFLCADAASAAAELARRGVRPDAVVVDPPRKGLTPELIGTVCAMAPERVVYVSCNAATQARDLRRFEALGYAAAEAAAVDMFPRTAHVETVVALSRKKPDDVIRVELNLEELDKTAAESKTTYEEIKQYVKDTFDLNVSTLYIAQVKRKLGLEMGIHYNISHSEDQKIPVCPIDKEIAIKAALKHFAMI